MSTTPQSPDLARLARIQARNATAIPAQFVIPPDDEWISLVTLCTTKGCENEYLLIAVDVPRRDQEVICGCCGARLN